MAVDSFQSKFPNGFWYVRAEKLTELNNVKKLQFYLLNFAKGVEGKELHVASKMSKGKRALVWGS